MIRTSFSDGIFTVSRIFAYCRVSTLEQSTENQRREIEAAGFTVRPQRLIEEQISGSVVASERPSFARLLDRMENGDVLIVTKTGSSRPECHGRQENSGATGQLRYSCALPGAGWR